MKFEKLGKPIQNLTIAIGPWDFAESNVIRSLNITIGSIKEKKPEILQEFLEQTAKKLEALTKKELFIDKAGKLSEQINQYENLPEYYDFVKLNLNLFMEILGVTEEQLWENKETEFPDTNFFQSVNTLYYHQLLILIDILGRPEALEFYKEDVTAYIETYDTNQKGIFKDLEDKQVRFKKIIENNDLGRVRLLSNVEDGKLVKICLNCDKINGLRGSDLTDKELLYAIVCEPHIPMAKNWNEHFVLTLEQAIGKGSPYCTYVFHDTRIVDKVEHSPKEVFDKIVPEHTDS